MVITKVTNKTVLRRNELNERILEIVKDHRRESIWVAAFTQKKENEKYYPGITITHLISHLKAYTKSNGKPLMPKKMSTINEHLKLLQKEGLVEMYKLSTGVFYVRLVEQKSE